jgi:hypothetical protein
MLKKRKSPPLAEAGSQSPIRANSRHGTIDEKP